MYVEELGEDILYSRLLAFSPFLYAYSKSSCLETLLL
jgi:hypothetical protein